MLARSFLLSRRALGLAAVLGVTALVSGCSLTTADDTTPRLTIAYSTTSVTTGPAAASNVEITGGQRFVQGLGGVFEAPCLTANRSGRMDLSGTTLTIRIIFTPNNAGCSNGPKAAYGYNAYVTNVQPGTYTVRVIHEGDAQVATGTVVKEQTVTVIPI